MTQSIAKVPGIASTSRGFRAALYRVATAHKWDVDAIAAVISSESRFKPDARSSLPGQTATGLLQWIDSTSRRLFGIPSSDIARLSAEQQVPLIETWFQKVAGEGPLRPVDFYLVGWGARPGLADDHVLATDGDRLYELNSALDYNRDGQITVSDLRQKVEGIIASAGGERIDASPLSADSSALLSLPASQQGSYMWFAACCDAAMRGFPQATARDCSALLQATLNAIMCELCSKGSYSTPPPLNLDGVLGPKSLAALDFVKQHLTLRG